MQDKGRRAFECRFFLMLMLVFALNGGSSLVAANTSGELAPLRVLIFNSYHKGFVWTDEITESILETVGAKIERTEFYIEYMDTKRSYSQELIENIYANLLLKYKNKKIDVIISSDDNALVFLKEYHSTLFANTPVVFCGVNDIDSALSVDRTFFTGVTETQDIKSNLSLIISMLPATKKIVVVTDGTTTGLGTRDEVKEVESLYSRIEFVYLNGEELATEEMLEALSMLEDDAAVLAPAWYRDKNGSYFNNTEIYPLISKYSTVPVFSPSSANLGFGPVGGKVNSGTVQGRLAAEYALDILIYKAEPKMLPIKLEGQNAFMFDSQQLTRFNIKDSQLPPDSLIINQPFSFYKRYKLLVHTVLAVFALFITFIAILITIIGRLRNIQNNLQHSEALYKAIVEDAPALIIRFDIDGTILFVNQAVSKLFSIDAKDIVGKNLRELMPSSRRQEVFADFNDLTPESPKLTHEIILTLKNGEKQWYRWTNHALFDDHNIKVIQAIGESIHKYKKIEEKLTDSLRDKEILLKEVHHRVKNNMQVIIALFNLQMQHDNSKIDAILQDMINRMQIFADIHSRLYNYNNFTQIDFKNHLETNFDSLRKVFKREEGHIGLELILETPFMDLDRAIPCGLLLNELMTNSFKHALSKEGVIYITLRQSAKGAIEFLEYYDSGEVYEAGEGGFGFTIIETLSLQLQLEHNVVKEGHNKHIFTSLYSDKESEECSNTILFVEDETLIALDKITLLQKHHYTVDETILSTGEEAIDYIANESAKPALLVMDVRLGGELGGVETAYKIRELEPDMPIIFLSGYESSAIIKEIESLAHTSYLKKTCSYKEFLDAVDAVFSQA